ncbi:hypothetical protein H0H81_011140 [Sphagnurus paluster]|uniref:Uncharacterized protein n=1 Tax=Sphagnurus paluster TaxID=117069 RepID=A0A9P7FUQ5_9AGAR|nr:hypothetical protein H0H81_011140 [Sphagnurus paluster]
MKGSKLKRHREEMETLEDSLQANMTKKRQTRCGTILTLRGEEVVKKIVLLDCPLPLPKLAPISEYTLSKSTNVSPESLHKPETKKTKPTHWAKIWDFE